MRSVRVAALGPRMPGFVFRHCTAFVITLMSSSSHSHRQRLPRGSTGKRWLLTCLDTNRNEVQVYLRARERMAICWWTEFATAPARPSLAGAFS